MTKQCLLSVILILFISGTLAILELPNSIPGYRIEKRKSNIYIEPTYHQLVSGAQVVHLDLELPNNKNQSDEICEKALLHLLQNEWSHLAKGSKIRTELVCAALKDYHLTQQLDRLCDVAKTTELAIILQTRT